MLPPPTCTTVRVCPTLFHSPVWSRIALIGAIGPYQRRNSVGSAIGKVRSNAVATSTGIARECSMTTGMAAMLDQPSRGAALPPSNGRSR